MNNQPKKILIIIILLLLLANGYILYKYYSDSEALIIAQSSLSARTISNKTLNFTKLLVDKVFGEDKKIAFEDRLRLENSVRDLNDPLIHEKWNNFINSKNQEEAQNELKKLLGILIEKIKPE